MVYLLFPIQKWAFVFGLLFAILVKLELDI